MSNFTEVKIKNINGIALDWAVAYARSEAEEDWLHVTKRQHSNNDMCLFLDGDIPKMHLEVGNIFEPSSNPAQAVLLMNSAHSNIHSEMDVNDQWEAWNADDAESDRYSGDTRQEAAMRSYVSAALKSDSVEIPEELLMDTLRNHFKRVSPDKNNGMTSWLHKEEDVWVTFYPKATEGPIYIAFHAVESVPEGRMPWTVNNRSIKTGDVDQKGKHASMDVHGAFSTLDLALQGAMDEISSQPKSRSGFKP